MGGVDSGDKKYVLDLGGSRGQTELEMVALFLIGVFGIYCWGLFADTDIRDKKIRQMVKAEYVTMSDIKSLGSRYEYKDINNDKLTDVVVEDGQDEYAFLGQPDGRFKSLERIAYEISLKN